MCARPRTLSLRANEHETHDPLAWKRRSVEIHREAQRRDRRRQAPEGHYRGARSPRRQLPPPGWGGTVLVQPDRPTCDPGGEAVIIPPVWHPADLHLSLDVRPAYGHPPGERAELPPAWLAAAGVLA